MKTAHAVVALSVLAGTLAAAETRYESLTAAVAKNTPYTVVAATFCGGAGVDELVAGVELTDGRILAIGNSWGPEPIATTGTTVLGSGTHSGAAAFVSKTEKKKKGDKQAPPAVEKLDLASPDRSGFLVLYAKDLARIESTIRCDWGVAQFTTACLTGDGTAVIGGKLGAHGDSLGKSLKMTGSGNGLLVGVVAGKPTWALRLGGDDAVVEQLWTTKDALWTSVRTGGKRVLYRVVGASSQEVTSRGVDDTADFLCVDESGTTWYGGDRNTHTGKEPWRQPFLYSIDSTGKQTGKLWEWASKDLRKDGHPSYGLVSDSSPRAIAIDPKTGDMIVSGWSDGGNSVFGRQPTDVAAQAPKPSGMFTTWGMKGANSLTWIMRIDSKSYAQTAWSHFMAYCPGDFEGEKYRGAPNFVSVDRIAVAPNGDVALSGKAATGLIQTSNAFWAYPHDGQKHGGQFAAVLGEDLATVRFSSYLPGYEESDVMPTANGLLIVGRSAATDGRDKPTAPPTTNAVQKTCNGRLDGHLVLLRAP